MRLGNKDWSGAPQTIAREVAAARELGTLEEAWIRDGGGALFSEWREARESQEKGLKGLQFIPADAGIWNTGHHLLAGYRNHVGQGLDSNIIMSPVMWIMRTFTEAVPRVQRRTSSGTDEEGMPKRGVWKWVEDHDLEILLETPNDFYNGDALWKATCISYVLDGNAYWLKVRNTLGDVIQLWYLPHWLVEPMVQPERPDVFLDYYRYTPTGAAHEIRLAPRDVIHFRFGLDPRNLRKGFSPLHPVLREVYTDDEAQNFSAKILENMGIPGIIVSPKNEKFSPSDEQLEKLKVYMRTAFTGQNRGAPMVMKIPTDVAQFGFDPGKLMLGALRNISEERVCAALGLPPEVVGFGAGSEATHVGATMREKRRLAWVQCLTPMQKSMAKDLTAQLLPDFQTQLRRFRVRFDTSDVSAYQEEDDATAQRVGTLVQSGILRVDRGQEEMGLEVDENRKVYYQPANVVVIGEDGKPVEPPKPPAPVPGTGDDQVPDAVAARMNGSQNGRVSRNGSTPEEDEES